MNAPKQKYFKVTTKNFPTFHIENCAAKGSFEYQIVVPILILSTIQEAYALFFYVTKTVSVSPKWFWSDQIDLDLTIMIWP